MYVKHCKNGEFSELNNGRGQFRDMRVAAIWGPAWKNPDRSLPFCQR